MCVGPAGYFRYLAEDAFCPFWEEIMYDAPLTIVMLPISPLLKFWTIPGWKAKGLAIVDFLTSHSRCAYARLTMWCEAAFALFGPLLGVAFVASCNATRHTCKFIQRTMLSAASHIGNEAGGNKPCKNWCSYILSAWRSLQNGCVFGSKNAAVLAATQEGGRVNQQQDTAAAIAAPAHALYTIELPAETETAPLAAKVAADLTATAATESAAGKQVLAVQSNDAVQSDLLKAHRAEPRHSSRAAGGGPSGEPDQAASNGPMLNKRARKAARIAAKAAAAAKGDAGKAAAPALLMSNLKNKARRAATSSSHTIDEVADAAVEDEGVKAAALVLPTADQADKVAFPTPAKQNKGAQIKDAPTGVQRALAIVVLCWTTTEG